MKKYVLLITVFFWNLIFSQSVGDIAFVGFNADGDNDLAIAVLADLAATNPIYITDGKITTDGKKEGTTEGILKWERASTVTAGTIVVFTDVDLESRSVSVGTLSEPDAGFSLNATDGDAVFVCIGDPTVDEMVEETTWLAGIFNSNDGIETIANFSATELVVGDTFVIIDDTASKDGGEYNGARSGESNAAAYRLLIGDESNWTTSTSDGESILPFDTTSFDDATLMSVKSPVLEGVLVSVQNGFVQATKGEIEDIYTIMGESIKNGRLTQGVYFVRVTLYGKTDLVKVISK